MRQRELTKQSDLPRGFAVGRYLVLDRIGTGGQSVMYSAYEPERVRKVTLRVFHQDDSPVPDREKLQSQFLHVAQLLARLSHPQLIPIYEIGTFGDQNFIAMEFVDAIDLPSWLRQQARSQQNILDVFILAGRGLKAAHNAGLLYAKFRPDIILIAPSGQVYIDLLDLLDGESTVLEAPSAPAQLLFRFEPAVYTNQLQSKALSDHGVAHYAAPEQYVAKPVEIRTDLFNFCAALYEALYTVPPFSGNTLAEYLLSVQAGTLRPVPAGVRSSPSWLRQALLRGLSAEPNRRYDSMDALLTTMSRPRYLMRWGWIWGGTGLALGVLLLLSWHISILVKRQQLLCSGAVTKLTAVWDSPRKEAIHDAFRRTGKPFAEETWQRLEQSLNRYAMQWVSMHNEACRLTQVRKEQSDALLDLRMRCLDRRLADLTALTQRLSELDEAWLDKVTSAAQSLPPVSACADVVTLSAPIPLPDSPAKRERVASLQRELSGIQTMQRLGEYVKSQKPAQVMAENARALGYTPLEAEALNLLATAQNQRGQSQEAIKTLQLAAASAIAGRDLRVAARAFTNLLLISGYRLQLPDEVRKWEMLASAALIASGRDQEGQVELASAKCLAAFSSPLQERTLSLCQESLAAATKFYGPTHYFVSVQLNNLAVILGDRKQLDQALQLFRQSLSITQQQLGASHPRVAVRLMNIGEALGFQGKYQEAIPYVLQAFDLQKRLLEPDNPQIGITLSALGRLQWGAGQLGTARSTLMRAILILKKGFPANHSLVIEAQVGLIRTLLAEELNAEAEQLGKRVIAEVGAAPPGRLELRDMYYYLGQALARQHRFDEALQYHRQALFFHEKAREETAQVSDWSAIGTDLVALKRVQEAMILLERGVQRSAAASISAEARAASQFALARALRLTTKRLSDERVLSLVRSARDVYVQGGPRLQVEKTELDRWLNAQNLDIRQTSE